MLSPIRFYIIACHLLSTFVSTVTRGFVGRAAAAWAAAPRGAAVLLGAAPRRGQRGGPAGAAGDAAQHRSGDERDERPTATQKTLIHWESLKIEVKQQWEDVDLC